MAGLPCFVAAGALVGLLFGLFGVGGSSFATPLMALLGVQGVMAVASPVPATMPAALAAAWSYLRKGEIDRAVARWSIIGGVPGAIIGALLSKIISGGSLLIASGVVLGIVGLRVLRPITDDQRNNGARRRRPIIVIGAAAAVGLFTGLLANGGGFLLVPLYLLGLGLKMRAASGTSLVVIAALTVPTLITHWTLGHIDWPVAAAFAAGAVPAALLGSRLAQHVGGDALRRVFGILLVGFAIWFTTRQALRA